MILVIAINIFSFITLKIEMDQIAEELIEAATYSAVLMMIFGNATRICWMNITIMILITARTNTSTAHTKGFSSAKKCV